MIAHTTLPVSDYARAKRFYEYEAALAAGGRDNGGPGYRDYWPGYYAAFVYDPDRHNIEAVWYDYRIDRQISQTRSQSSAVRAGY